MCTTVPKVGDIAPDFTAPTIQGERVHLYELLNHSPVVLFFLVKPFTPVCTLEACAFRNQIDHFLRAKAIVLGVSGDEPELARQFSRFLDLPFTLLLDPHKSVRKLYGLSNRFGFFPTRATFVINQERMIQEIVKSMFHARRHVLHSLRSLHEGRNAAAFGRGNSVLHSRR
jgi:peroxiredoxin Q/BCP